MFYINDVNRYIDGQINGLLKCVCLDFKRFLCVIKWKVVLDYLIFLNLFFIVFLLVQGL